MHQSLHLFELTAPSMHHSGAAFMLLVQDLWCPNTSCQPHMKLGSYSAKSLHFPLLGERNSLTYSNTYIWFTMAMFTLQLWELKTLNENGSQESSYEYSMWATEMQQAGCIWLSEWVFTAESLWDLLNNSYQKQQATAFITFLIKGVISSFEICLCTLPPLTK